MPVGQLLRSAESALAETARLAGHKAMARPAAALTRCENSRRSARILDIALNRDPSPAEPAITHDDGPVVA